VHTHTHIHKHADEGRWLYCVLLLLHQLCDDWWGDSPVPARGR